MPEKLTTRLFNNLRDSFQSDWKLLSETEHFLASTPLQRNYEQQFALWRKQLQIEKNDAVRASIRGEIIALRKALRLEGYDLSLGSIQLIVEDFVNDDAAARGFQRVVICFCDVGVFWLSGEANHLDYSAVPQLKQKKLSSGCKNELKQTHKRYCAILKRYRISLTCLFAVILVPSSVINIL